MNPIPRETHGNQADWQGHTPTLPWVINHMVQKMASLTVAIETDIKATFSAYHKALVLVMQW